MNSWSHIRISRIRLSWNPTVGISYDSNIAIRLNLTLDWHSYMPYYRCIHPIQWWWWKFTKNTDIGNLTSTIRKWVGMHWIPVETGNPGFGLPRNQNTRLRHSFTLVYVRHASDVSYKLRYSKPIRLVSDFINWIAMRLWQLSDWCTRIYNQLYHHLMLLVQNCLEVQCQKRSLQSLRKRSE